MVRNWKWRGVGNGTEREKGRRGGERKKGKGREGTPWFLLLHLPDMKSWINR